MAVDLAVVQKRAQHILAVDGLAVGRVDRLACVDVQQFEAGNAALRRHVDAHWRDARDLAALALVLVGEVAVLRELVDGLESELRIVDAHRLSAVEAADRRLRELERRAHT